MKARRRRLSDLYVRGKEVDVSDDAGEPVRIWLQKLNAIDREGCLRRANAAKARFMTTCDDEESDFYQSVYAQTRTLIDRPNLIAIIVAEEVGKYRQRTEAQLTADEEGWGKEGYIQGLADSWIGDEDNPGLAHVFAEDPEDDEALRVKTELDRFDAEITERTKAEEERLSVEWESAGNEEIWRRATRRILENRANDAFFREFERQELFYSVRDVGDHSKRYFGTLTELDDLDDAVISQLRAAYNTLTVDPQEGKGSQQSRSSSNSSAPSTEEETSPGSGPEDATEPKTSPGTSSQPSPTPQPSLAGSNT